MKRSIVCFSILTLIVLASALSEVIFSNMLAEKIDDTLKSCETADFETRAKLCKKLKDEFESHEAINELFFSRDLIEKIDGTVRELIVYAEHGDSKNFERALALLAMCNEGIYNAGIF